MRRFLTALLALALLCPVAASAEPVPAPTALPSEAAQLAAAAVVSLHNAVMRDVLGSDLTFSTVAGGDPLFVLYTDADELAYLLVSFDEDTLTRAETAVLQTYDLKAFEDRALLSLQAIALPFLPDDEQTAFAEWLQTQQAAVQAAYYAGNDFDLSYYDGTYVSCALSLYHEDGRTLFTALTHWYTPLSAEDITTLME